MHSQLTHPKKNRWLTLIAAYKILQALLLIRVGFGALRLMHRDIADTLANLISEMRFDTDGRFVSFLLDKAASVDDPMLRRISAFVFIYAGLGLVEGIGLFLEKLWAEYFTAIITASFLPLEILEILHRLTWIRVTVFAANFAVFLYLIADIGRASQQRRISRAAGESRQ